MMHIALPQKELRLLSFQIQKFPAGYTVEQIRILDKVMSSVNSVLEDFTNKIEAIKQDKDITEEKMNMFFEEDGNKIADLHLEEDEFQFLSQIWTRMGGLSGDELVRKSIIVIDDAFKNASAVVFNKPND